MSSPYPHTFVISMLLAALLIATAGAAPSDEAADEQELLEQLEKLDREIKEYQEMLEETRDERSGLEQKLKENEKEISELLKEIEQMEQELKEGEENLSQLRDEQSKLESARMEQQTQIAKQIRAAWETGSQGYLKVLLNQEDPHQIARMLTYYDYFNRARADRIHEYTETIVALREVESRIETQNRRLARNREALETRSRALVIAREEKEKSLAALTRQIAQAGTEVEKLMEDREHLEKLLDKIDRSVVNLPKPSDTEPFASLQGDMLMPVSGNVTNPFGSDRSTGKLRWNGIFIEADEGEPVHAIHYGRVVFSDWLRGFGLLLIINHGDGYMSLYGHNQVIYRETGDWVKAGEVIATVGNSGGQSRSGTYFEIRNAGKPADPQRWCQARPDPTA
ncbi:MAG: peptidoglycan DD-metalloendopeptidase family protein [Pseudomonadales bacterium]